MNCVSTKHGSIPCFVSWDGFEPCSGVFLLYFIYPMFGHVKFCHFNLRFLSKLLQLYNLERNFQQTTEGLMSSRVSLRVQLQSSHFGNSLTSNNVGQLVLRCSARIGSIYQEFVEKELGVTQRDPIPAKGEIFILYLFEFLKYFKIC
jgi:hypothetical protein